MKSASAVCRCSSSPGVGRSISQRWLTYWTWNVAPGYYMGAGKGKGRALILRQYAMERARQAPGRRAVGGLDELLPLKEPRLARVITVVSCSTRDEHVHSNLKRRTARTKKSSA